MAPEFEVEVDLQKRFRDLDALGHVNNAVFLSYLEMGRVEYYRQLLGEPSADDFDFILARVELDFLAPVTLGDPLRCCLSITEVGRSSFTFDYLLCDSQTGREFARARSVQVCYDYKQGKVKPVDEKWLARVVDFRAQRGLPAPAPKKNSR